MIPGFDFKEEFLGTGLLTDYSFDFKIFEASDLYVYIQNNLGVIVSEFRGDDPTYVSSVTFDTESGGGTISLVDVLPNAYPMTVLLANDEPDQPTDFPNKQSFTLGILEGALDYIAAWGQRVAYLAQRSLRVHDLDDIDDFDMRLPFGLGDNADRFLKLNADGNGWDFGPTYSELTDFFNAAVAACAASEAAAADSEINAHDSELSAEESAISAAESAAAAAASAAAAGAFTYAGPFAAIAAGANSNLLDETTDHTKFTAVDYVARVVRGTTTAARQEFSIFYRNGAWEIAIGPGRYANLDSGVTFTVDPVTAQINAAVDSDGGSDAIIDIFKTNWPV